MVVHLRVDIPTYFTRIFDNFSSFKVDISITSTVIFFLLHWIKFVTFSIFTHIFSMASKTIGMCRSAIIYITFCTKYFSHRGILS